MTLTIDNLTENLEYDGFGGGDLYFTTDNHNIRIELDKSVRDSYEDPDTGYREDASIEVNEIAVYVSESVRGKETVVTDSSIIEFFWDVIGNSGKVHWDFKNSI